MSKTLATIKNVTTPGYLDLIQGASEKLRGIPQDVQETIAKHTEIVRRRLWTDNEPAMQQFADTVGIHEDRARIGNLLRLDYLNDHSVVNGWEREQERLASAAAQGRSTGTSRGGR